MARSSLFRQIARVRGRVAKGLGQIHQVTLYQQDHENRNRITGEPAFTSRSLEVQIPDPSVDGITFASDKRDRTSRLTILVFDPDVKVSPGDYFLLGGSSNRHTVHQVFGELQDVAGLVNDEPGSRYVSRCIVD